jgi:hypothetical protein
MPEKEESKKMYQKWEKTVRMSKGWDEGDDEEEQEEGKKEEGKN